MGAMRAWLAAGAIGLAGFGIAGCGVPQSASGAVAEPTSLGPPSLGDPEPTAGSTTGDPFAKPIDWPITPGTTAAIAGTLGSTGAIDVFDIGPIYPGDRIAVEVLGQGGLNPAVALLDADQDLLIANDDRSYYAGRTDPLADAIVRNASDRGYVAVAVSPFEPSTGEYTLKVSLTPGAAVDPGTPQRVYLNFDGADGVVIGSRPAVDVPPFDPATIDANLTGRADQVIDLLVDTVVDDYAGLQVEFYSSRYGAVPPEPYTTIHFGAFDPELLGVAENVDEFNEHPSQEAIVFVDTFAAFAVLEPSLEEYAQALANVTSHEVGHLLGLQHTADPAGIMDVTASLRRMLANQAFSRSPLHEEVFPAGYQDAVATLLENVGGNATLTEAATTDRTALRAIGPVGPAARLTLRFGSCGACRRDKAKRTTTEGAI
ncbi:MAG: matrixin family metalloprotease [bacterium]|nr:matrixin family metalloprotease [bacterium]